MQILSRNTKKVGHKYYVSHRDKYAKIDDQYYEADTDFNNSQSKAGDILLVNKNTFSYGIRKDKNSSKLFGLRPDDDQSGSKQIEFSINNIKYNGSDYSLDLKDAVVNKNEVDMGDVKFNNLSGIFKQFYKAVDVKDFVITIDLDLTGYTIKNDKFTEEKTIKDTISCEVHNMGKNTATYHFENTPSYLSQYVTNTNEKKLTFLLAEVNDKSIMLGEYEKEDEFTDPSLSGYTTHEAPHNSNASNAWGGSTYLKDTILIYCKGQNIDTEYFEDIILNNICDKYNLDLLRADPESRTDIGEYFLYNNKKVGGWYIVDDDEFIMYFNTKEIPDDVKTLFKKKTFNQASYLDLELNNVVDDFKDQFNYNMVKVDVDTNYYQPLNDTFVIEDSDARKINLNIPYVIKEDGALVDVLCGHSLEQISSNKYRYKKFIYPECSMTLQMKGVTYIDPTLDYSEFRFDAESKFSTFSACRNSGSYNSAGVEGYLSQVKRTTSSVQGGGTSISYSCARSSYRWNVSSVSGQVSGVLTTEIRGNGSNLYAIKDNRAKTSVALYSDFSAWVSGGGWDEEDYTSGGDHADELYINNQAGPSNFLDLEGDTHSFALTDAAITAINADTYFDMFFIGRRDIENEDPGANFNDLVRRGYISSSYYDEDMNLVLSDVSEDVAENVTFFGSNF